MSTKLTDKNKKSVFADIPKKGYRTKFWREYRASAAKASGVGKIMDAMENLGLPASGDPTKVKEYDNLPQIVQAFSSLSNAMLKAEGKCGIMQSQTKEFCRTYRAHIRKQEAVATKLAQNIEKLKQKDVANELANEKANKKSKETYAKFKKDKENKDAIVRKEIQSVGIRADRISAACKQIIKDVKTAQQEQDKIRTVWKTHHKKEGVDRAQIETKADAALRAVSKKYNIATHGKNIKDALPKLLKELTNTYAQFGKLDGVKKERMAAGKAIAHARGNFTAAQDELKFFAVQHRSALEELQAARPEGV